MEASVLDSNSTRRIIIDSITRTIRYLIKHEEELAAILRTHFIHSRKMASRLRHSIILSPVTHPLSLSDQVEGILLRQREPFQILTPTSNGTTRTWDGKIMISRIMTSTKTRNQSTSSLWRTRFLEEIPLKKKPRRSGRFVRVRISTKTSYIRTPGNSSHTNWRTIRLCPLMRSTIWISVRVDTSIMMTAELHWKRIGLQLTDPASGTKTNNLRIERLNTWIKPSKSNLWIEKDRVMAKICLISPVLTRRATSSISPVLINFSQLVAMMLRRKQICMQKYINRLRISRSNKRINKPDLVWIVANNRHLKPTKTNGTNTMTNTIRNISTRLGSRMRQPPIDSKRMKKSGKALWRQKWTLRRPKKTSWSNMSAHSSLKFHKSPKLWLPTGRNRVSHRQSLTKTFSKKNKNSLSGKRPGGTIFWVRKRRKRRN